MKRRNKKHGIATMAALVALTVVGVTVLILAQTIAQEQRREVRRFQRIQADRLAADFTQLTEADPAAKDLALVLSREALGSVSDLRLERTITEEDGRAVAIVTVETTDAELPAHLKYSKQKILTPQENHEGQP